MDKPKITWLVRREDDSSYAETRDFYSGTYDQETPFIFYVRLWNNRYGTTTVEDLDNFSVVASFEFEEDSALLKHMTCIVGRDEITPDIMDNQATFYLQDVVLSGSVNDGSDINTENFVTLRFEINIPETKRIKINDLKPLCLSVVKI